MILPAEVVAELQQTPAVSVVRDSERELSLRRHRSDRTRTTKYNRLVHSVSVKRRHSVFDAQNFGQNSRKRKTVRQVTQRIFR